MLLLITDLSCALDDKKYEHNETWFDEGRAAVLTCLYREIIKLGQCFKFCIEKKHICCSFSVFNKHKVNCYIAECRIGNETVAIGQIVEIDNGCSFACHPQANLYLCDKKLGNFTVIEKVEATEETPRREKTRKIVSKNFLGLPANYGL